jgi:hypothetical protein
MADDSTCAQFYSVQKVFSFNSCKVVFYESCCREVFGPFNDVLLDLIWIAMQLTNLLISMYLLSMQTAQFSNVFLAPW